MANWWEKDSVAVFEPEAEKKNWWEKDSEPVEQRALPGPKALSGITQQPLFASAPELEGGRFRGHGAMGTWEPVGAWEKLKDIDILDVISHLPGSAMVGLNDIRKRIYETAKHKIKTGDYGPTTQYTMTPMGGYMPISAPATREGLQKIINEYEEKEARGETTIAAIMGGIADLPAFMGEMKVGGIVQVKSVPQALLFAGKIMPIQFGRIESSLSEKIKKGEKGYMALAKSMGDVYIENLSETAGAGFPVVARKLPFGGKMIDALHDFARKSGISDSVFWKRMGTKVGYNGLLGEWGEERLGTFLRGLVNVDDFGAGKDSTADERIMAGLAQDLQLQNQLVEIGILSAPGAAKQVGKITFGRREEIPPAEPTLLPPSPVPTVAEPFPTEPVKAPKPEPAPKKAVPTAEVFKGPLYKEKSVVEHIVTEEDKTMAAGIADELKNKPGAFFVDSDGTVYQMDSHTDDSGNVIPTGGFNAMINPEESGRAYSLFRINNEIWESQRKEGDNKFDVTKPWWEFSGNKDMANTLLHMRQMSDVEVAAWAEQGGKDWGQHRDWAARPEEGEKGVPAEPVTKPKPPKPAPKEREVYVPEPGELEEIRKPARAKKATPAERVEKQPWEKGIEKAISEEPKRMTHGYGFVIDDTGKVFTLKEARNLTVAPKTIEVHSHLPDRWQKFHEKDWGTFTGPDLHNIKRHIKEGRGNKAIVLTSFNKLDYIEIPKSAQNNFLKLNEKSLINILEGKDYTEGREKLRKFADDYGLIYKEGLTWPKAILEENKSEEWAQKALAVEPIKEAEPYKGLLKEEKDIRKQINENMGESIHILFEQWPTLGKSLGITRNDLSERGAKFVRDTIESVASEIEDTDISRELNALVNRHDNLANRLEKNQIQLEELERQRLAPAEPTVTAPVKPEIKQPWEMTREEGEVKIKGTPQEKKLVEEFAKGLTTQEWKEEYRKGELPHWMTDKEPSPLSKELNDDLKKEGIKQANILEIGCGNGRDSIFLAKKGHITTGIDVAEQAVSVAKKNAGKLENATFEKGNVEKLKYPDESFDAVFSVAALHSSLLDNSLAEIYRVLKQGGIAKIHQYTKIETAGKTIHYWKPEQIKKLAEKAGFSILESHTTTKSDFVEIKGVKEKIKQDSDIIVYTIKKTPVTQEIKPEVKEALEKPAEAREPISEKPLAKPTKEEVKDNIAATMKRGSNVSINREGLLAVKELDFYDWVKNNQPLRKALKSWMIENKKFSKGEPAEDLRQFLDAKGYRGFIQESFAKYLEDIGHPGFLTLTPEVEAEAEPAPTLAEKPKFITKEEREQLQAMGMSIAEIGKTPVEELRAKLEGKKPKGPLQASVGASKSPQLDAALQRASEKTGRTSYVSQRNGKWIVTSKRPEFGDYYEIGPEESKLVKGKTTYSVEADAIKAARYIAKNTKKPIYVWQGKSGFKISDEKPKHDYVQINPKGPGLTRAEMAILSKQQIAEAEIAQEEKQKVGFKMGRAEALREARNKMQEFLMATKLTDKHRKDAADVVRQYVPKEHQYRYIKRILEAKTNKRLDNLHKAINLYLDKAEKRAAVREFRNFIKRLKSEYRRGETAFGKLPKKVAEQLMIVLEEYDISKLSEEKQKKLESRDKFVKRIAAELASGFEAMNEDFDKDATDMLVMGTRRIEELKRLSQTYIGKLDSKQIRYIQSELENLIKINDLKGQSKERRRMENLRTDINQARQEVKPAKKEHVVEFTGLLSSARWIAVEGQSNISTLVNISTIKDNAASKKILVDEPKKANRERLIIYKEFIDYFKSKIDGKKITWKDIRNLEEVIKVRLGGKDIEMSRDSILSIYAHTQAEGNMRRLLNTKGLNITTYYKTALGLIQKKKMFRVGAPTLDELRTISEMIPEKHKALLEAYFETNKEKQAPAINKTSMEYQNYELARSEKYFHVDREIDRPIEGTRPDVSTSIDMMGRYLPRTGGSARINIRPFSMEVMKAMQSDAAYSTMLIPMENARALLANRHWRENMKKSGNYKALRELTTMFRRVQGLVADQSQLEMAAAGVLRNISKSILSARISGGLVQTASIPAAFEVIEPKYFVGTDAAPTPGQIQKLKDMSPVLWMRWEGKQFDYALGLVGTQNAFESMLFGHLPKTDKLLAPYTIGDEVAIWKIWNAAKRKVAAETELEKNSKEFNDKAMEILYKALDTQPQWDILHRSPLTSSPNVFLRGMALFMSARNSQYNVLIRAMDDYRKDRIGKAEFSKRVAGVGMANVFVSLARRLFRIGVKVGVIGLLAALGLRNRPKEKAKQQIVKELEKIPTESVFNLVSLNAIGGIFNNLVYTAIRQLKYPGYGNLADVRSGNMFADLGMDFMQLAVEYTQLTAEIISREKYKSGPRKDQYKWKQSAKDTADLTAQVFAYFLGLPYEGPKADFIWPAKAAAKQTDIEKMTTKEIVDYIKENTYKTTKIKKGWIVGEPEKGKEKRVAEMRAELKKRKK